jgi:capsular polysaccharide biosynthesis protein
VAEAVQENGHPSLSDYIGLKGNNTVIEACFFHKNFWRYVLVQVPPGLQVVQLDEAYWAFPNQWYSNFYHFMTEMLPELHQYVAAKMDCPIIVPRRHKLMDEIMAGFGIEDDNIVEMQKDTEYQVSRLHYCGYPRSRLEPEQRVAFQALKDAFAVDSVGPAKSVYLGRNDKLDLKNCNNSNGAGRVIVNEDEVLAKLSDHEVVNVGSLSMREKAYLLKDVEQAVAPFGGGIINFIVAPRLKRLQILAPRKHEGLSKLFSAMVRSVNPGVEVSVVYGEFVNDHSGIDINRSPYVVPIGKVTG